MSGIVFYKTLILKEIVDFYIKSAGAEVWLDQGKCVILKHGNFLFGFCEGDRADISSIITFFYPTAGGVNNQYEKLQTIADDQPKINQAYRIYHFFARDPEGRKIEFQTFLHRLDEYWTGSQLLKGRRSIREFSSQEINDTLLMKVMELCRYSPTSRNSQSFYYVITRNKDMMNSLSAIRDRASSPLSKAPLVVAVCADPEKTKRPRQDACIAAYHLLLAAAQYGLGTCWITDMDRPEVKEMMKIPQEHYVACLTPLGFPVIPDPEVSEEELRESREEVKPPARREAREIFRFI